MSRNPRQRHEMVRAAARRRNLGRLNVPSFRRLASDLPPRPRSPRELTPEQEAFRDGILGVSTMPSLGGIRSFEGVSGYDIQMLIDEGYVNTEDAQNYAPSIKTFVDYVGRMGSGATLHGYAVSASRPDCRVSIEGCTIRRSLSDAEQSEFLRMFRDADELDVEDNYARCWFD